MSHTPLDESGERAPDRGQPPDEEALSADSDSLLGRVRSACRRFERAVLDVLSSDRTRSATGERHDHRSAEATVTHELESQSRGRNDDRSTRPVLSQRSGRDRRAGERPVDRPELDAEWGDGRLTLAEPDDRDASISSDTWTDVEP